MRSEPPARPCRLWPSEDDEDENANESAAHTHVVDLQLLHEKLARSLATGRESEFDQRMTLAGQLANNCNRLQESRGDKSLKNSVTCS